LQASPQQVPEKVSDLFTELDRECKRALALEQELAKRIADSLLPGVELINGINILSARISPMRLEVLRALGDQLKERLGSGIFILGTIHKDKPHFVAMVTPDLTARGFHAGEIVREVAKVTGGGGGGKSELGQGSGKDKSKLDEALMLAKGLVRDWKE
jgi:alanyl-tRNA synthetase